VDLKVVCKCLDRRASLVLGDELVDLAVGEASLDRV
jgi:hypothetical protein